LAEGGDVKETQPLLWLGDFNVAPLPCDVYDSGAVWPHVCHCQEVIDALARVTSRGFIDLFRKHLPQPNIFTFWDYRARQAVTINRGWRIDHLWASAPLAAKSEGCFVDLEPRMAEKPSDHTFVAVRFASF
jgi:exodeoxyribonuclease-3